MTSVVDKFDDVGEQAVTERFACVANVAVFVLLGNYYIAFVLVCNEVFVFRIDIFCLFFHFASQNDCLTFLC